MRRSQAKQKLRFLDPLEPLHKNFEFVYSSLTLYHLMNFTESETFSLGRLRDTLIRLEDTIIFGEHVFHCALQSFTSCRERMPLQCSGMLEGKAPT